MTKVTDINSVRIGKADENGKIILPKNYLEKCPFCGADAYMKEGEIMQRTAVYVTCPECHCRTMPLIMGEAMQYRGRANAYVSRRQAVADAAKLWNTRRKEPELDILGAHSFAAPGGVGAV